MELLVTYAISLAVVLYLGYALVSTVGNAIENGDVHDGLRESRAVLIGLVVAALGGFASYYRLAAGRDEAAWSIVFAVAIVCGALTTLLGGWARNRLDDGRD